MATSPLAASSAVDGPYRVMVVDDSAVTRGLLVRALESDGGIAVVATAGNGRMALDALRRHDIELVLLDLAMPVMDGLAALPLLLAARPQLKVIMVSSLTRSGAAVTLKALGAGAADCVTKPSAANANGDSFRGDLLAKVKALVEARRTTLRLAAVPARGEPPRPRTRLALRPGSGEAPQAIAIGSSTGGPMALYRILAALAPDMRQPIFITQHMPPTFTAILAEQLGRVSGWPASEAVDGAAVQERRIYVAPGDYHMLIEGGRGGRRVRLTQAPPENYCRPAVDPMLRSLAEAYGGSLLCAILTGMGQDGLKGAGAVAARGGTVLAQDQASSVVWGMPGAVAMAGLASAVLPLDEIGPFLARAAMAGAS